MKKRLERIYQLYRKLTGDLAYKTPRSEIFNRMQKINEEFAEAILLLDGNLYKEVER